MAALVGSIEGEWIFTPAGTGTMVTWQWILHPKSGADRTGAAGARQDLEGLRAPVPSRRCSDSAGRLNAMCRLFGLHAGKDVCAATFWLLDAPDSLAEQSRRNPDGTGLGVFDEHGRPQVHKQPIAAWQDVDFATEAHRLTGTTFIAHVRYATTGSLDVHNTHPFLQDGRIFAHNGVLEGLDVLDARLREVGTADLVLGQTDSERVFALITASIRAQDGDVTAGLVDAMTWLAANVPIYAVNVLLSTATDMWALRYPEPNRALRLGPTDSTARPEFDLRTKRIRAWSEPLCTRSSVVFATERMDDDPRWSLMAPGELVHVDAALRVTRNLVLPDPPRHLLRREDLSAPVAAGPQHTAAKSAMTTRRALVLAGGGLAGIAWETGILCGIADESPAAARLLLDSDVLVGTSAGSAVAAQISSGRPLEDAVRPPGRRDVGRDRFRRRHRDHHRTVSGRPE